MATGGIFAGDGHEVTGMVEVDSVDSVEATGGRAGLTSLIVFAPRN